MAKSSAIRQNILLGKKNIATNSGKQKSAEVRQMSSYAASFAVPRLGGGLLRTPNGSVNTVFCFELVRGSFGCSGQVRCHLVEIEDGESAASGAFKGDSAMRTLVGHRFFLGTAGKRNLPLQLLGGIHLWHQAPFCSENSYCWFLRDILIVTFVFFV